MVEGISVSGIFPTGFTLDYGSIDAVSVGTAVHSAEWPWPGVQMQIVTKSGGNRYRGTLYANYERRDRQSFNIDSGQVLRGERRSRDLHDARVAAHLDSMRRFGLRVQQVHGQ